MSGDHHDDGPSEADLRATIETLWAKVEEQRAGGVVLAAVVDALEDPTRPEEPPVDAVRRLRAEVGRLTPDTPGAVSDHVRSRFAEASAAALAGEGGCNGAGCIPAHQACEVLDAYDDARADADRLTREVTTQASTIGGLDLELEQERQGSAGIDDERTEHSQEVLGLLSNAAAVKVQHDARVERLTRERDDAADWLVRARAELPPAADGKPPWGQLDALVAGLRAGAETAERERDAWIFAARTGRWRELLDLAPDVGEVNEWGESVRERAAFDAVREASTTVEPGGDK